MPNNNNYVEIDTDRTVLVETSEIDIVLTEPVVNLITLSGCDWGLINGDINEQTDLMGLLDDKQDALGYTAESTSNKVRAFQITPDDVAYPTEKLVKDSLDNKVDKEIGKGLSTNDFTTTLKNKLDGIADGAEVNVQADWSATSGDAYIANKPDLSSLPYLPLAGGTMETEANITLIGDGALKFGTKSVIRQEGDILNIISTDAVVITGNVSATNLSGTNTGDEDLTSIDTEVLNFDITKNNPVHAEGKLFYDKTKHALSYYNEESDITINIGQEVLIRVKNMTGSTILNGAVVYPLGFADGEVLVGLAIASDKEKCRLIGVATNDIPTGETGYVTKLGEVGSIDTDAFVSGDIVYLSETVAGGIQKTKPIGSNYITRIGAVKVKSATVGSIVVDIATSEQTVESTQDVGFSTSDHATLSYVDNDGTPTPINGCRVTINPIGDDYCFYQYGDKYCKTTDNIKLPDEEGLFVIYYNLGTLAYIKNPTNSQISVLIENNPVVAYVYWNATDNKTEYCGYELHGIGMNAVTHEYLHFAFGARYMNGLAPNTISADASGNLATSAQFGVDAGAISDEDIYLAYSGIGSTVGLPIAYLSGTSTVPTLRTTTNAGYSVLTTGSGRLAFNTISAGSYVLSEVSNGDFALCHVIAINENNAARRLIAFVGQASYTTLANARAGATTEITALKTVGIFPQESKAIATFVFETQTGYTNAVKSRIRTISTGVNYVDWRTTYINGSNAGGTTGTTTTIFNDGLFQIIDNLDATKVMTFQNSSITTGNTRVLTVPDKNITIAGIDDVALKQDKALTSQDAPVSETRANLLIQSVLKIHSKRLGVLGNLDTIDVVLGSSASVPLSCAVTGDVNGYAVVITLATGADSLIHPTANTVTLIAAKIIATAAVYAVIFPQTIIGGTTVTPVNSPTLLAGGLNGTAGYVGQKVQSSDKTLWELKYTSGDAMYWSPDGYPAIATEYFSHYDATFAKPVFKMYKTWTSASAGGASSSAHGIVGFSSLYDGMMAYMITANGNNTPSFAVGTPDYIYFYTNTSSLVVTAPNNAAYNSRPVHVKITYTKSF